VVRGRATALLHHVGPAVLRQDSTGRIGSPADAVADTLGLPQLIAALHTRLGDDLAVANAVQPWLYVMFEAAVEREAAEAHALTALPHIAYTPVPAVLLLDFCSRDSDVARLAAVAWVQYPDALVLAYCTVHEDAVG